MGHHFQVLTNYTWSHCTSTWDFAGELAGPIYQNPLDRANGERGNCGYDHRQVFNGSLVATSPGIGPGAARFITKDWQISPIVGLFTGNPIQITDGKDVSLSGQSLDRPTVVLPSQVYPSQQTAQEWFNPAAFAYAATGTFGNLGRNSVYGPGMETMDLGIVRGFNLKEKTQLEMRAEFFNALNHTNLGTPDRFVNTSTFSSITESTTPGREVQLSARIQF